MKNHDINLTDDRALRRAIKDGLPGAPEDPQFTRKVMNRLPARKRGGSSRIEIAAYALSFVIIAAIGASTFRNINATGVVTIGHLMVWVSLGAMSIAVTTAIVRGILSRN